MINPCLKILLVVLLAALGGEFLISYTRRTFVNPRQRLSFDASGMIERSLLVIFMVAGGWLLLLIPPIMIARAYYVFANSRIGKTAEILNREEPAVEFQKVLLKSELIITLFESPAIGVLLGMLARFI